MSVELAALSSSPVSGTHTQRRPLGFRLLFGFWTVVLLTIGIAGVVLQILGPPAAPAEMVVSAESASPHPREPTPAAIVTATPSPPAAEPPIAEPGFTPAMPSVALAPPPPLPVRTDPGTIAAPEPGLQEPSPLYQGARLPRIGADRRMPLQIYASPFNASDPRPRVSVLLAGMGMNESETLSAINALPPPISLAFSPYAYRPEAMLAAARARGHEYLLSIPMEPLGYPLNDPGNRALLTGATMATNAQRLEWVMTRFAGYVGATGALGEQRGERFAAATDQMAPLLDSLADRGLLYVDPRPNVPRLAGSIAQRGAGRGVDLVLDDPPGRTEIDQKLARLEQLARDRGAAIGLAGRPSPLMTARLAAWATTLATHGLNLAPVSVVVQMPQAAVSNSATAVRTTLSR